MPFFRSSQQPLLSHSIHPKSMNDWEHEGCMYASLNDPSSAAADKKHFNVKMRMVTSFKYCPVERQGQETRVVEVQEDITRNGSKNIVQWTIPVGEETFTIELQHGTTWGKRKIYVNDTKVVSKRKLIDDGSHHRFTLTPKDGKSVNAEVWIKEGTLTGGFIYELYLNGAPLEDNQKNCY